MSDGPAGTTVLKIVPSTFFQSYFLERVSTILEQTKYVFGCLNHTGNEYWVATSNTNFLYKYMIVYMWVPSQNNGGFTYKLDREILAFDQYLELRDETLQLL